MDSNYDKIKAAIKQADNNYYNNPDNASMPDEVYDALYDELINIEADNPDLISDDSPSHNLTPPSSLFEKVRHLRPMLSLEKITKDVEVERFVASIGLNEEIEVSTKLDGMALSLYYDDTGNLVHAVSRGDGEIGEDLTVNALHVIGVHSKVASGPCSIRGEVVIPKDKFELIKDEFVNARNAAAGALRSKDPNDVSSRHLHFYAYEFMHDELVLTATDSSKILGEWGFSTPVYTISTGAIQTSQAINSIFEQKDSLPYEIDGVVLKANKYSIRESLGFRDRSPRWAVAFKEASEVAVTTLIDIGWQIGKTGIVSPVAILDPVFVEGATVTKATLHNLKYIEDLGLYVGAKVRVTRSNSVIPRVLGLYDCENPADNEVDIPSKCPACSSTVKISSESKIIRCTNYHCIEQVKGRLISWASRNAANIDSIGETWIETLVEAGFLNKPSDFYKLTERHLYQFDRMGDVLASKFVSSINKSKDVGLRKALVGLSIPFVSEGTAKRLVKYFGSIHELMGATFSELSKIDDIGPETASSIINFFSDLENKNEILTLLQLGVNLNRLDEDAPVEASNGPFYNKTVVITGTLSAPRSTFISILESLGAKVSGSISKNTDFVLAGENAGSKLDKAMELNISIISETDFANMLNGG